jgi:NAD(P)-dependent dehydrogenase (short-subunit alcohol dehydrogenase family)
VSGFTGRVAVVTGAGSGIGRALALGLAERGARLALSDVDAVGLAETVALIPGADVHDAPLDVSDRAAVTAYADTVAAHFGVVNQVYNNAGIAFSRLIADSEYEHYDRVLGVNLWGVIHGTKAFLPHLIASGDGHVVNVSSVNGFLAQPEMSHYVTSKFAVRGFTETLRAEMLAGGHPVRVSCVHPGGIRTNIATNAVDVGRDLGLEPTAADEARRRLYNERILRMTPEKAAQIILDGVSKDRPRILVGSDAKAIDLLVRALPATSLRVAGAAMRRMLP